MMIFTVDGDSQDMKSYGSKALATISIMLMIATSLTGCESNQSYPPSSPGVSGGSAAAIPPAGDSVQIADAQVEAAQIEVVLNGYEQILDTNIEAMKSAINLGNKQLASGYAPSNCITVLQFQAQLQELVINGRLSSSNSTFIRIGGKLGELHSLSECAS
jgi:hypothetical protein